MTDDEFERYRQEYLKVWKPHPPRNNPHPALNRGREEQSTLLEAAFRWMGRNSTDDSWDVHRLVGGLLAVGAPVSDSALCAWLDDQGAAKYPFSGLPLEGIVQWIEHQEANAAISQTLLGCARKHFPAISRKGTDRSHRLLMRRLSVALKLSKDDVIPEKRDAWTATALRWRDSLPHDERQRWESLFVAANAQHSTNPNKAYLRDGARLAAELEMFPEMMRDILESLGRDGPVVVKFRGYASGRMDLLDDEFTDLLRALIWLCTPYSELIDHLRNAGERCLLKIKNIGPRSAKIAAACAYALSQRGDASATQAISRLGVAAKHKSTRKGVSKAVTALEDRTGKEWDILEETSVPAHGLSNIGTMAEKIGGFSVRLVATRTGAPAFEWSDGVTTPLLKAPVAVTREHPESAAAMKARLCELKKTWRNQILRLETMMCHGRRISGAVWRQHYLSHPSIKEHLPCFAGNEAGTMRSREALPNSRHRSTFAPPISAPSSG